MTGLADVVRARMTPATAVQAPEGFERLTVPLVNGLPATIDLDAELSLVLVAPTGLATTWRDAAAHELVSASDAELAAIAAPAQGTPPAPWARVERFPLRLVLRAGGRLGPRVPLVLGLVRELPDAGVQEAGALAEVALLGWEIRAGTLRGAGDFGSQIQLAWRRADGDHATAERAEPHPRVIERIGVDL